MSALIGAVKVEIAAAGYVKGMMIAADSRMRADPKGFPADWTKNIHIFKLAKKAEEIKRVCLVDWRSVICYI